MAVVGLIVAVLIDSEVLKSVLINVRQPITSRVTHKKQIVENICDRQ
jgi:hypothetical protein